MRAPAIESFSYGGGVQSNCALVLAARREIPYRTFLFANVGEDSEHPATLEYVRNVAMPYAAAHGLELVELHRYPTKGAGVVRCFGSGALVEPADEPDGTTARCIDCQARQPVVDGVLVEHNAPETLYGRLTRPGSRSLPIPVRMSADGAPGTRSCTADFKIRVIGRELKRRGATVDNPANVGIGISVDEIHRARPGVDPRAPYQSRQYPLLNLGLYRDDCKRIIAEAGLPVPPKSACWFCPLHNADAWRELKRETPDLFHAAAHLEHLLNERRDELGKDPVWLTRKARPLAEVFAGPDHEQLAFDGDDGACDSGHCFT